MINLFDYSGQDLFNKTSFNRRYSSVFSFASGPIAGFFGVEVVLVGRSFHDFFPASDLDSF